MTLNVLWVYVLEVEIGVFINTGTFSNYLCVRYEHIYTLLSICQVT